MPKIKLTIDEINHLLRVAASGILNQVQIAEDWGVSRGYVSRLVSGKYVRKAQKVSNPK